MQPRRRWLVALAAVAMGASVLPGPAGATNNGSDPLVLGLLPFASPGTLFNRFAPLRDYLETRVDRPVRLATAPDFPTFVKRTQRGRYAILLTAPHFTLMALDSGQYEVRATYTKRLSAVIIGRSGGTPSDLGDPGCDKVATPPPSAIITLMGRRYLAKRHPEAGPTYKAYPSHNSAVRAVLGRDACLAVASVNVWNRMRQAERGLVRHAQTDSIPALGILFRKDLAEPLRDRLTKALVTMQDNPEGQQALEQMAYPGYQAAKAATFEPVRPYLDHLPAGWPEGADPP